MAQAGIEKSVACLILSKIGMEFHYPLLRKPSHPVRSWEDISRKRLTSDHRRPQRETSVILTHQFIMRLSINLTVAMARINSLCICTSPGTRMKKWPFYNKWAPIWTNMCSRFRSDGALKGRWSPSGVNIYKAVIVASSAIAGKPFSL